MEQCPACAQGWGDTPWSFPVVYARGCWTALYGQGSFQEATVAS